MEIAIAAIKVKRRAVKKWREMLEVLGGEREGAKS